MEIYVLVNEQPQGPYTPDTIRERLKTGDLQSTQLAAYAGSSDWVPLAVMVQNWPINPTGDGQTFGARTKPKKSRTTLFLVAAGVGLLVLAMVAIVIRSQRPGESASPDQASNPLPPGIPNTPAALDAWYATPPARENAALLFNQANRLLDISDDDRVSKDFPILGNGTLPDLGEPLPPRMKARLAAFWHRNEEAWGAFLNGAKFEHSRYPVDLTKIPKSSLPDLSTFKRGAQAGELRALMSADSQQPTDATDALLATLSEAQSLKAEPLLISQLVRVACLAIETSSLERVLNLTVLSTPDLSRLAAAIAKAEAEESAGIGFTRAMVGERVSVLHILDLPPDQLKSFLNEVQAVEASVTGSGPTSEQHDQFNNDMRNLKTERAFAEETFNRCLVMRESPFPGRFKMDDYFAERLAEASGKKFALYHEIMVSFSPVLRTEARSVANLRLMQTAVALEQNRSENGGRFPDTLASLSPNFLPAIPTDPFDGKPLRYRKKGSGYQLYSIGKNMQDDGGKREAAGAGDQVFEIVRVPKIQTQSDEPSRN